MIMRKILVFIVVCFLVNANFAASQIDEALRERVLSLVKNSRSVGPERYDARTQIWEQSNGLLKIWFDEKVEILRDGKQLRVNATTSIENFKQLQVPSVDGYLVSAAGTYKLSKGDGTAFFALWRSYPPTPIEDKRTLAGQLGTEFHFRCNHVIGDWFSDWIVRPGLEGADGFQLERLTDRDGSTVGRISGKQDALKAFSYLETKTFDFVLDAKGHVQSWNCNHDATQPNLRYFENFNWQEGRFAGKVGELKDGERTVSKWVITIDKVSDEAIAPKEFSLSYFGIESGGSRFPLGWVIAFSILCVGAILGWLKHRSRY